MLVDNVSEFINLMDAKGNASSSAIGRPNAWSDRWRTSSSASVKAATNRLSS